MEEKKANKDQKSIPIEAKPSRNYLSLEFRAFRVHSTGQLHSCYDEAVTALQKIMDKILKIIPDLVP